MTTLVKNVTKQIVAKNDNFVADVHAVNDVKFYDAATAEDIKVA